jgi:hypothetical protein
MEVYIMSGQIKSELERRKVRAELLDISGRLADIAKSTTDADMLTWTRNAIISVCVILQEKTGLENDIAIKKFDVYVETSRNPAITNAELATKVGLCESTVRKIKA